MSLTKKQKRAARLKAMVPIEILTKEYQISREPPLTDCSKELEDFLCDSDLTSADPERLSPEPISENIKHEISTITFEKVHSIEELPDQNTSATTIKRGRLKRKHIAENPDMYNISKAKNPDDSPKYICTICEKSFHTVAKLQNHHQIHLPQEEKEALKKFHCEYCPRTFKELYKLNSHKSFKHLKEYKYICEICGRPFINSSELKRHASVSHSQKKPCTICGKQVLNIAIHYKEVHENIPKECAICLKVYPNQKKLNKHRYVKHPFQIFECEICEKTYSERFCYKKHLSEKHGIVIQENLIY